MIKSKPIVTRTVKYSSLQLSDISLPNLNF